MIAGAIHFLRLGQWYCNRSFGLRSGNGTVAAGTDYFISIHTRNAMYRLLVPLLTMLLLTASGATAQPAGPATRQAEPQIWFITTGQADSANMWTASAPWQHAARKVNVLVLVHEFISQMSVQELTQIRDFAAAHHMQIDLSTEAVAKLPNGTCGAEEGYTYVGENADAAQILFNLGFKVDWVDMDAPMNSGSYDTGPQSCQLSITDLIPRVVSTLQGVVALYPHVKLLDVEPLPGLEDQPTWRQDVQYFHAGLAQGLGVQVAAMQTDVNWLDPTWPTAMAELRTYLHQQNLMLSVIYDPNAAVQSDSQAITSAVANFEAVEGQLNIIPDMVSIESWDPYPAYAMPETSPTALTWLIDRYTWPRSLLQVQFVGQGAEGKLTTTAGKPIANATVNGYIPGVDFSQPLPVTVIQGSVPSNAVNAIIIVRVNAECGCNGLNHLLFGTLAYQETAGGTVAMNFSWPTNYQQYGGAIVDGQTVGGTTVTEVYAPSGQSFTPNSNAFAVTAGAQYSFTVPASTVGGLGWFGYAGIVWLDVNGMEITRTTVTPPPGQALESTAVTQADGTFTLSKLPRTVDGPNPVSVQFDGGGTYRSTVWTPLQ